MKFTHLIKRENLALNDLFVYFVSAPRRVISKQAPFSLAWKETRDIRGLANHEKHFSRAKTQQLYFSMIFFNPLGDLCPYLDTKSVISDFEREDVFLGFGHLIIPTPKISWQNRFSHFRTLKKCSSQKITILIINEEST